MEQKLMTVGKVRDAHGMRGELYVILFAGSADWLAKAKTLTFSGQRPTEKGKHQPETVSFPLKSCRAHKKGLIAKLEGLSDRTQAEGMIGYLLEIPTELLRSEKGETIFLAEVVGFEVLNGEKSIGRVLRFASNGAQDLLVVGDGQREWEIPFVPQLLDEILWAEKKIRMSLPEGLVE